jgi:CheY-like chemotaxis protein
VQDVTSRKRAEEALRQADQKKDEFLAMLGHELRNPMAAIGAAASLLSREGVEPSKLQVARESLTRRVNQMARLVDDLLDVSRITRGKIELKRQNLELSAMIEHASESVRSLMQERRQELVVRVLDPLPVFGDPVRLEQIVANLLTNASRYSDEGHEIALTAFREGREAVIQVKDHGIGISPEMLGKLFEPLSQAAQPLARSRGGLGLGLTICKTLCNMHGGTISARSAGEGQGSEFEVRLPLGDAYGGAEAAEAEQISARPLRVLLVEDHPDTAYMEAAILESEGHAVEVASNGLAAIEKACATRPDAILLDIGLPGCSGFEVAERVRQAGLRDTLIIAVTGYGQERDLRQAREAGIDGHLLKPVDCEKLCRLLAEHRRALEERGPGARN